MRQFGTSPTVVAMKAHKETHAHAQREQSRHDEPVVAEPVAAPAAPVVEPVVWDKRDSELIAYLTDVVKHPGTPGVLVGGAVGLLKKLGV